MTSIKVEFSMESRFGSTRDQGHRPTCLSFAASDTNSALRTPWMELSVEYLHFHTQLRSRRTLSEAAILDDMLETLKTDGQPLESFWPYEPVLPTDLNGWKPPSIIGDLFYSSGLRLEHKVSNIADSLRKGMPTILLLELSQMFFQGGINGVVDLVPPEKPDPAIRHAVVATALGRIGKQVAVLIRNSWGSNWGLNGSAWLTENYLSAALFGIVAFKEQ